MKKLLSTRDDIEWIVRTFYEQVRADDLLGPIFNAQITNWEAHLLKITGFWEQAVLMVRGAYFGNPLAAHVVVDEQSNHAITPTHFGKWLYYWINTIDQHYEGEHAEEMKNLARKMQTVLYLKMFEHKPKN